MSASSGQKVIGVLALQGAVEAHRHHIEKTGAFFHKVKRVQDLEVCDGLILPGGESTTMLKLIDRFDLKPPLTNFFNHKPVWGICAGCILMARNVKNPVQESFGLLPIDVRRNAYGRQLESHESEIDGYHVSFIRAPVIESFDQGQIKVKAEHADSPAWVLSGQFMATTFHPELNSSAPSPMHRFFYDLIQNKC